MRTRITLAVAGAGCAILLSGIASAAPGLSVSPSSIAFGVSCVGAPIAGRPVTMTNTGDEPLTVGQAVLAGSNPQDFTLQDAQARTIPPGESATFKVGFLPRVSGDRSAVVRLDSNASNGTVEIPVTGRGATRILEITPDRLAFGDQRLKTSDDDLSLSLASTGSDPVRIAGVTVTGSNRADFSAPAPSTAPLSPGSRTGVTVGFRPGGVGRRTATVTIDSDACVGRMIIPVEGNGTAPDIKVDPTPMDLGRAAVGLAGDPVPIVLSNRGRAPLRITRIALEGAAAADFRFDSLPDTPKVLGAGQEVPLTATFTPSADGPRTAILRIESDDPDTPVLLVEVRGNVGTPGPSPSESSSPSSSTLPSPTTHPGLAARKTGSTGGLGDWIAVAVVLIVGGGAFGGLIVVARRRAPMR